MIGNQIQNYKIISLLGEGGMANVYLAQHQSLGNNVAIKFLKEEYVQNSNIRKRFLAEARNLAKMSHPNIIKVTDLIDAGDIVAFVMEYIEGQTLDDFLIKKGKLTSLEIEGFFNQMILAVEYVHEQGLIHRDIKPSNFMVTKNGQIKLLDFGIAKNTNDNAVDYTKTGLMQQMGTPMYMSPEQVKNTSEVTKETDIYSLGVVLWQMVMNKKPYDSVEFSLPEIQVSILKDPLPLTNTIWDSTIQTSTEKESIKRSLKFTSKRDLDYKSVSDTVIDTAISNPNKKEKERKAYFNIKNLSIGSVILFFGIILIYFFSNERITEKSILISDGKISDKKIEETLNDTIDIIKIQDSLVVIKKESKQFRKEKEVSKKVIKEASIEQNKLQIGQKYEGGIVFYLDKSGKHGKVCTERDLGTYNWDDAINKCESLNLNGYSDWYLPSRADLWTASYIKSMIGVTYDFYWTSTEAYVGCACSFTFLNSDSNWCTRYSDLFLVRAVRNF